MITITRKGGRENKPADFLMHRFSRIYPNYWFYFFITFAIFLVQPSIVNASQGNRFNFFRSFFLIPSTTLPLVLIAWSLIYEVYFYIVFSFLINVKERIFIIILLAWLSLLVIINIFFHLQAMPVLALITSPYSIEFILGSCSAMIVSTPFIKKIPVLFFFMLAGIIILSLPFLFLRFYSPDGVSGLLTQSIVFGFAYSLLVTAFVSIEKRGRGKFPAFFVKLGDMSYTIYLSHLLIMGAIGKIWAFYFQRPGSAWDNMLVFPFILICIIIYSYFAYRLIERPSYQFFIKLAGTLKKKMVSVQ
jgi:peptidoglycan/LPS O-acetylase OafA/YrhL